MVHEPEIFCLPALYGRLTVIGAAILKASI